MVFNATEAVEKHPLVQAILSNDWFERGIQFELAANRTSNRNTSKHLLSQTNLFNHGQNGHFIDFVDTTISIVDTTFRIVDATNDLVYGAAMKFNNVTVKFVGGKTIQAIMEIHIGSNFSSYGQNTLDHSGGIGSFIYHALRKRMHICFKSFVVLPSPTKPCFVHLAPPTRISRNLQQEYY